MAAVADSFQNKDSISEQELVELWMDMDPSIIGDGTVSLLLKTAFVLKL